MEEKKPVIKTPRPKRSLTIYLAVFFSAVLIILFVASYAQGQQIETQGEQIESTKNDLQTKSSALETLQKQYSDLELQYKNIQSELNDLTKVKESLDALVNAQNCYNANDNQGLKRNLENVDQSVLTPDELKVYNHLKEKEIEKEKESENNA